MKVAIFVFLTAIACSGTNDGGHTLVPSRTVVLPLEVVILHDDSASFDSPSYQATLSGASVTLYRASPTELGMLVPQNASGMSALRIGAIDGADYADIMLTVGTAPIVEDPVAAVHGLLDSAQTNLVSYQSAWSSRDDLEPIFDALSQNVARLRMQFDGMSTSDQATVAQALAANATARTRDFATAWAARTHVHWNAVALDIIGIATTAEAFPPVAIACAIKLAHDLAPLLDDYGTGTGSVVNYIPDSLNDTPMLVALTFSNGQPTTFALSVNGTNLSSNDVAMPTSESQPFVEIFQSLDDDWDEINRVMIPSLGAAPNLSDIAPIAADTPVDTSGASVKDIVGNVTLTASTFDSGSATLTFSSPACTVSGAGSTAFSFVLAYTTPDFAEQTATISASLSCDACNVQGAACCAGNYCGPDSANNPLACSSTTSRCCYPSGTIYPPDTPPPSEWCCFGATLTMQGYVCN